MKKIVTVFLLAFIVQSMQGQEVKLTSYTSKDGKCKQNYVYAGPHKASEHWGTCISAGKAKIDAYKVIWSKLCKKDYVYVGPNRVDIHGGYCVKVLDENYRLFSSVANKHKNCGANSVYVGPNKVTEHFGSCLELVEIIKPVNPIPVIPQDDSEDILEDIYGSKPSETTSTTSTSRSYAKLSSKNWIGQSTATSGKVYTLENTHPEKSITVKYQISSPRDNSKTVKSVTLKSGEKKDIATTSADYNNLNISVSIVSTNY